MSTITYLKNFIKDKNVASITPTSPFGVRKVCEPAIDVIEILLHGTGRED